MISLRKDDLFEHRYWLDARHMPDKRPLLCIVTRVAQGTVYYRPFYGRHDDGTSWLGSSTHFPIKDTARYVGAVLETP